LGILLKGTVASYYYMSKLDNQPIGEILQQAYLISSAQIDVALRDQQRYQELNLGELKIGEILALRGWLRQETTEFFIYKWHDFLKQKHRQPLGYYLYEAGLLSEQQIRYLLEEQQKLPTKLRLGELAYLEGWLSLKTIDYFVKNLSIATPITIEHHKTTFALLEEHHIIKQYINGETNFQSLKLNQVHLKNAMLKGVNLSQSDLEQAFLQGINLNDSNLKYTNLNQANLEQASLKKTNFSHANLSQANLQRACLESANLKQANLQKANLKQASLIKASLEGADLRGAKLRGTLFYGAYYDRATRFDSYFNPLQEGMRFTDKELYTLTNPKIILP
jgi:Pentapeptide repeats (8 copies)